MHEVFSEAVALVNLPFTVLLGLVVAYWLLVALGALDTDFHGGSELHAHAEGAHTLGDHGDVSGDGGSWAGHTLHFINVGAVPLMVVMSVLALCLWMCSLIANFYFTGHDTLLGMAALVPNLLVSMVVTRYLTMPLKPLFRLLRRDEDDAVVLVGQSCRITTSIANEICGQAEIETKGAPLRINVRTLNGTTLARGATALVVREDRERDIFFVMEVSQLPVELR